MRERRQRAKKGAGDNEHLAQMLVNECTEASTKTGGPKSNREEASTKTGGPKSNREEASTKTGGTKSNREERKREIVERGAALEGEIIDTLKELGVESSHIFHNIYLATEKEKFTQIDITAVTSAGVLVIESKDLSGSVSGDVNDREWKQVKPNFEGRDRHYSLYNPIMQNKKHIDAFRAKLSQAVVCHSITVFGKNCTLEKIENIPTDTYLTEASGFREVVREILADTSIEYDNIEEVLSALREGESNSNDPSIKASHSKQVGRIRPPKTR